MMRVKHINEHNVGPQPKKINTGGTAHLLMLLNATTKKSKSIWTSAVTKMYSLTSSAAGQEVTSKDSRPYETCFLTQFRDLCGKNKIIES